MSRNPAANGPQGGLLELYDEALPLVYGYLRSRCGAQPLAEDLTTETFLAAVDAVRRPDPPTVDTPWLIGVAQHKLIDHWRRAAREERGLRAVGESPATQDPREEQLDAMQARATLERLGPHHRAALTLRYLDDLPVRQVAALLGRTLHATEALLVRARAAFRRAYDETGREAVADPLDVLRAPSMPVDPDPDFAAHLRARIERALTLPKGVAMTTTTTLDQPTEVTAAGTALSGTGALTPYLAVADARAAIDWYVENLAARAVGEPIVMPDGRIGHAELQLAGARLFLTDEHPEIGVAAPASGAGTAVSLHLDVDDVDAVTARAEAAHAVVEREPSDNPYGRVGVIRDPFGHRWMLNSAPAAAAALTERVPEGDVGFFSLWVDDVERAAVFYADVLGWSFAEDGGPGRTLEGTAVPHRITALADVRRGFWPDQRHATLFCSRGVADLDDAVERVRTAGGGARERTGHGHNRVVDCVDDQGAPFSLHENGTQTVRPAMSGARQGDVGYLTMQVIDSARARDFYGAMFDWTFTPGRVDDGWQLHDPAPLTGLHGGHKEATLVPMYRVDDIAAAVERVRTAGGTATDPDRQPYGVSAFCADDQGTPFYLGQL